MKYSITPEEHALNKRRRVRQMLGFLVMVLALIGALSVLSTAVGAVAKLFDDTAQRKEYEDKLEGLVLFDPLAFDGVENLDDLTLRSAAVWGCIEQIQDTEDGFTNYAVDPETEQLLLPSVEVDAYLTKLLGPGFKLNHTSFEIEGMTIEYDENTQSYKIPLTDSVGYYRATVTKLFKRSGKLYVTVGYIPLVGTDNNILSSNTETPTKYMDYVFERQNGSWYLTGLTDSETKPEASASVSSAAQVVEMAEIEVQNAIVEAAPDANDLPEEEISTQQDQPEEGTADSETGNE